MKTSNVNGSRTNAYKIVRTKLLQAILFKPISSFYKNAATVASMLYTRTFPIYLTIIMSLALPVAIVSADEITVEPPVLGQVCNPIAQQNIADRLENAVENGGLEPAARESLINTLKTSCEDLIQPDWKTTRTEFLEASSGTLAEQIINAHTQKFDRIERFWLKKQTVSDAASINGIDTQNLVKTILVPAIENAHSNTETAETIYNRIAVLLWKTK